MRMITLGLFGVTLCAALVAACGDDDDDNNPGLTGGSSGTSGAGGSAGDGVGGAGGGASGTGGGGGVAVGTITVLANFDGALGELPEGLAIAGDGTPYVGFAPKGEIVRFRSDGTGRSDIAKIPPPPPEGKGFMTGLALDSEKRIYAALVSFDTTKAEPGIYRVSQSREEQGGAGGAGGVFTANEPWAQGNGLTFPNGIALDEPGKVGYVTDSAVGAIYRFGLEAAGEATLWVGNDPLLAGDPLACGGKADDLSIGANGLVKAGNTFYVANTNKGTIVSVTIDPATGVAGTPALFAESCADLKGADGLAPDGTGGVYVAVNSQNKIVRVDRNGAISTLVSGGELDFPASVVSQGNALYVTNFALNTRAKPALLRVEIPSREGR